MNFTRKEFASLKNLTVLGLVQLFMLILFEPRTVALIAPPKSISIVGFFNLRIFLRRTVVGVDEKFSTLEELFFSKNSE